MPVTLGLKTPTILSESPHSTYADGVEIRFIGLTADGWMALATFLAAFVPLVLFLYERHDRKTAERALATEREDRAAQERIGQARAISPSARIRGGEGLDSDPVYVVPTAANYGIRPVFDVEFFYEHNRTPTMVGYWSTLAPNQAVTGNETFIEWDPNDPLETGCIHIPRSWIEFTDVEEQRWRRYADGTVEACDPYPFAGGPTFAA